MEMNYFKSEKLLKTTQKRKTDEEIKRQWLFEITSMCMNDSYISLEDYRKKIKDNHNKLIRKKEKELIYKNETKEQRFKRLKNKAEKIKQYQQEGKMIRVEK